MVKKIAFLLILLFTCGCQQEEIKIYLAGDSTMSQKRQEKRPETGWGEKFSAFFNTNVIVENHAENGASTRTFIEEGRWQNILDSLKAGDYVLIQFGHNDQPKWKVDKCTTPEQYKKNLTYFVKSVYQKEAIPVLLTPVARRRFNSEGEFYDTHAEYPDIVRKVASLENVTFIDANILTNNLLTELGSEKSKDLFLILKPGEHINYPDGSDDNTHSSDYGARTNAKLIVEKIKEVDLDLKDYIIE